MADDFFTGKDGTIHPITKKKGGRAALAAAGAAVVMATSGGGIAAGTAGGAANSTADVSISRAVHVKVKRARRSARKGHAREAWRRMGLKQIKRKVTRELGCVAHSYGEVRQFLLRTPCRSFRRELAAFIDPRGAIILVSISQIRMRSMRSARQFRRLESTYGTGDISPRYATLLEYAGIRFTGQHYDSRRVGTRVTVAEAEPVTGHPSDEFLNGVAEVAVFLPPRA